MTAIKSAGRPGEIDDLEPWYKQFWPWFLISLPAAIVLAGIAMITMAVRNPVAMVDDNYYKRGLAINEDLAARELAADLGLSAEAVFDGRLILVDLNAAKNAQLELHFIHATDARRDQSYDLQPLGIRRFEGRLQEPFAEFRNSRYKVRLVGESILGQWLLSSEIWISGEDTDRFKLSLSTAAVDPSKSLMEDHD